MTKHDIDSPDIKLWIGTTILKPSYEKNYYKEGIDREDIVTIKGSLGEEIRIVIEGAQNVYFLMKKK